jgi:hypothetical protein
MRRIISLTILVLVVGSFAPSLAQSERRPVSTKFDEYGSVGGCDHGARLDNFAIQLQNQPGSTAYIFAYAPKEIGKGFLEIAKAYLVMSRGISPDLIKTVYGGRNDVLSEPRIQLWIAPPGAARPKPQKFKPNLETFRGLFAENPGWDYDVREAISTDGEDEKRFPVIEGEDTGPAIAHVTHPSLAEVLKEQKTALAYIVAYNGEESSPGAWQRMAQQDVQRLKDLGIEGNRLKIVYGGNKKEPTVQLWVTPADAPVPVADAGPEQPPSKAVSLASLSDLDLGYSGVERAALKRMVDALRQFPTLRACVVVTFGTYEEPPEEAAQQPIAEEETPDTDESTAPELAVEPEPDPADVAKLVEKWKDELAEKYKIGADRFVVLFTHSDGFSNNMLETWVVPFGADLPKTEEEPPAKDPVPQIQGQRTKQQGSSFNETTQAQINAVGKGGLPPLKITNIQH